MQTWFFPERMNNGVMTWAVLSGTVGFILFFAGYFINKYLFKKQENLTPFKIKWSDLGKTLLLAVILFASYYSLDMFLYTFLHLDYRFLFVSARPVINNKMFAIILILYCLYGFIGNILLFQIIITIGYLAIIPYFYNYYNLVKGGNNNGK